MWWKFKLYFYFFVFGFLLDFTTVPEFLFWESKGFNIEDNRYIALAIHVPYVIKFLFAYTINNYDTIKVDRVLKLLAFFNCIVNFVSSYLQDFILIVISLAVSEVLMANMLTCLEYHMVKDETVVSYCNISRLIGKSIGQLISLMPLGVTLTDLFFISFCIQVGFTFLLATASVSSPDYIRARNNNPDETSPTESMAILVSMDEERPVGITCKIQKWFRNCFCSCCDMCCTGKPISNFTWLIFILTAVPFPFDIIMYYLVEVRHFQKAWFGFIDFYEGLTALFAMAVFSVLYSKVKQDQNKYLCTLYIGAKIFVNILATYGVWKTDFSYDQAIYLWLWVHIINSFIDEAMNNLFIVDTTRISEGSVFYLGKCQFTQIGGMIVSFILTTLNICAFSLDTKNYESLYKYMNLNTFLYMTCFLAVFQV